MSIFNTLRIGGSSLTAQRLRMDIVSSNIANADSTRTPEGGPYRPEKVVFAAAQASQPGFDGQPAQPGGVSVAGIWKDPNGTKTVYEPGHPDADANGFVVYPDVNVVTEMTDMMSASRAYEATVTVMNASKEMAKQALQIGRG